ncbi:MAG: hypothetical protein LC772_09070 [Chloroflexi bacterium]|nr:hypothetical protein [Chloroflexota bacterium]
MTIELAPALEARLREAAARAGVTVEDYLADLVERASDDRSPETAAIPFGDRLRSGAEEIPLPATPAEAIEYWKRIGVGTVFVGGPDSPELARQLRNQEENLRSNRRGAESDHKLAPAAAPLESDR